MCDVLKENLYYELFEQTHAIKLKSWASYSAKKKKKLSLTVRVV